MSLTNRVDEVPKLWLRAGGVTPEGEEWMQIPWNEGYALAKGAAVEREAVIMPDWLIDLSDPIQLAGLAHSVAVRLEEPDLIAADVLGHGIDWLARELPEQEWWPAAGDLMQLEDDLGTGVPHYRLMATVPEVLVKAAQYLTLTDRLCAAVGLEREGSEVARWERWIPDGTEDLPEGWLLTAGKLNHCWHLDSGGDDWLPALRAALESTNG